MAGALALPTLLPRTSTRGDRDACGRDTGQDLKTAIESPDPFVRTDALARADSASDAIVAALTDDYPLVRREAVRALGRRGDEEAARVLLRAAAHDPAAEVREEAVSALAGMMRHLYPAERS